MDYDSIGQAMDGNY